MPELLLERDKQVLSIRQHINANNDTYNPAEAFQNKTIRPIIKLQSDLILLHVKMYLQKNKPTFNLLNFVAQKQYLAQVLKSDIRLKTELNSFVIALFTKDELWFYYQNQNEVSKRISEIIYSRCIDLIEELF